MIDVVIGFVDMHRVWTLAGVAVVTLIVLLIDGQRRLDRCFEPPVTGGEL